MTLSLPDLPPSASSLPKPNETFAITVATNLSSPAIDTSENADWHNGKTATWAIIGVVTFFSIAIGLAIAFKMWRKWRRPKSIAPSAAYQHRYAAIGLTSSQNTLFDSNRTEDTNGGSRNVPRILTPASGSFVYLPDLFVRVSYLTYK